MNQEQLTQLRVGALVALNSDSPRMTVTGWSDATAPIRDDRSLAEILAACSPDTLNIEVAWINSDNGTLLRMDAPAACFRTVSG